MKDQRMMKHVLVALAVFATVPAVSGAQTAQTKIGVVATDVILKELPAAVDASKKLEEYGTKVQDTLRMMQKDFEQRIEQYQKQQAMMAADAKKKEEESLQALRMRFLQYQEEKLGAQGEIARMRESLLKPIRDKVQDGINNVAKEEKLTIVLDKTGGLVLFSEDKLDITFKVLDRMKRGDK
jgi:outer membrane protein